MPVSLSVSPTYSNLFEQPAREYQYDDTHRGEVNSCQTMQVSGIRSEKKKKQICLPLPLSVSFCCKSPPLQSTPQRCRYRACAFSQALPKGYPCLSGPKVLLRSGVPSKFWGMWIVRRDVGDPGFWLVGSLPWPWAAGVGLFSFLDEQERMGRVGAWLIKDREARGGSFNN